MLTTTSLINIRYEENKRFQIGSKNRRLIAILFCRPELDLMKSAIIPSLHYFHRRSGGNTAFYFGGFELDLEDFCLEDQNQAAKVVVKADTASRTIVKEVQGRLVGEKNTYFSIEGPGRTWYFIPDSFNEFRKEVEQETAWRYSGGCDMILLNSKHRPGAPEADLDFSSSLVLKLDEVQKLVATPTISRLFEAIFQYAEAQNSDDPAWGLSDMLGLKVARHSVWDAILAVIPNAFRPSIDAARLLVVQDISKA